jgi:hypothetical protein
VRIIEKYSANNGYISEIYFYRPSYLLQKSVDMLFTCIIKLLVLICADNNPHWHCVAIGLSLYKSDNFSFFIDHNLSWNIHIEKLCKKIASGIGALKRTRPFVPCHTLLSIFNSLVQPHFDYCSVVWGNCSKTFSTKLQKLQNRAARIITYSNFDVNADLLSID